MTKINVRMPIAVSMSIPVRKARQTAPSKATAPLFSRAFRYFDEAIDYQEARLDLLMAEHEPSEEAERRFEREDD